MMMQQERKVAVGQRPKVDQRIGDPQFRDKSGRPGRARRTASSVCTRKNGSPSQSHSCPLLSMTSQQTMVMLRRHSPSISNASRLRRRFARSTLRYSGSTTTAWHRKRASSTDRHVQIEDPTPAVVVGDVTAERRPDDRREQRRDAEDGHRRALFFRRKRIEQNRPDWRVAIRRRPDPAARGMR